MRFRTGIRATAIVAACALLLVVSGCRQTSSPAASSITIAGSTSVQPVSELLAEVFTADNPGTTIHVQGGGSSAGIRAATDGAADIGASSRDLKPDEQHLTEIVIGLDGIAIIVHPGNAISDLSLEQVQGIFAGTITNWSELGGPDTAIVPVTREEGSGTRGAFEEIVMAGVDISSRAIVQNSSGAVRTSVAQDPNAVGYLSLAAVNDDVKTTMVDGVEPTVDNIKAGTYRVSRPFIYLVTGEPSGLVKEFLDFVVSPAARDTIARAGLINVH